MKTTSRLTAVHILLALAMVTVSAFGQAEKNAKAPPKPTPDLANFKYGPHQRNVLDFWKAKSDQPTPLVVFIHGGGFRGGSKEGVPAPLVETMLRNGISVMSVNYRLSPEVKFPAHYLDCARALQTARLHAREWNLDPKRVGATGGSAGAGTSLWLGFHDDLANAASDDPVLRQSTRLTCMAVTGAQSSYDPRDIKAWVGGRAHEHIALEGFFGLKGDELNTPAAHKIFVDASPINHLTKDDVPVYAFYNEPKGPLPPNAKPGDGIHHLNFGIKLKEKMDPLGLECTIRHQADGANANAEIAAFFLRHLLGKSTPSAR